MMCAEPECLFRAGVFAPRVRLMFQCAAALRRFGDASFRVQRSDFLAQIVDALLPRDAQRWRSARSAPTRRVHSRRTSRGPSGAGLADLDFALMAQWQSICLVNKRSVVRSRVRAVRGFFLFFLVRVIVLCVFLSRRRGCGIFFGARRSTARVSAANALRNAAHREISPPAPTSPLPAPRPPRPPPCPAGSPP